MDTPQLWGTANSVHHSGTDQEGLVIWDQKGVVVVWPDGHRSRLPWTALRAACQCPECHAQRTGVANPGDRPSS
jgi:DUF971 family protein